MNRDSQHWGKKAAAHQPVVSPPPASPPSKTACTTTLRRHAPLPRIPAEDFKIVYRPGGGLDLRTTTNGALLQTLCTRATIDYASARTADRVPINPYNNSLTVSTPSEPRARLYLRVSELRLGAISYPLRAYMAAPDNALRGIIHNAVDSQTQDEIVQDLQSMNVNTPYAIADARQMGHSKSILITFVGTSTLPSTIVFNCGVYHCHPFRPRAEACTNCWAPGHRADGAHVTGSRSCGLRFERNGPSSPPATSKHQPPPPAPPTVPILKTPRPSRPRHHSVSRGAQSASRHRSVSFPPLPRSEASTAPATTTTSPVSWKPQPPTSNPQTTALEATIAAQQLQIQELSRQLQAALVRLSSPAPPPTSPAPAPPQPPSLAVEPMNTASSAASSRASCPNRSPPLKRRSPSSDPVAPERDVIRQTTSFLEAFEKRVMARFARLEERVASIDTRVAAIESHLTALDTRVAALETRQSATEATIAHLSLPAPLTPAPTPTLSGDSAIHHGQTPHAP
nr:E3 ubiquitin-protein ligase synoviolin-like [Dermacentor andersoni]